MKAHSPFPSRLTASATSCSPNVSFGLTVELDRPYSKIEFIGCRGRLEGTRVILNDIPAWKFAGFIVSNSDA